MPTTHESKNSSMTSRAYDLLDCFVAGLDDVIYEIAEAIAKSKGHVIEGVVEINDEDVKEAAESVFKAIREQAGKSIPAVEASQIDEMHECVLEKCRIQTTGK